MHLACLGVFLCSQFACRDISNFDSGNKDKDSSEVSGSADQAAVIAGAGSDNAIGSSEPGIEDQQDVMADEPIMVAGGFLACYSDRAAVETSEAAGVIGCGIYDAEDPGQLITIPETISLVRVSLVDSNGSPIDLTPLPPSGAAVDRYHWTFTLDMEATNSMFEFEFRMETDEGPKNLVMHTAVRETLPVGLLSLGVSYSLRVDDTDQCLSGNPSWSFFNGIVVAQQLFEQNCEETVGFAVSQHEVDGRFRLHTENPDPWSCDPNLIEAGFCFRSCMSFISALNTSQFTLFGCTANIKQDFEIMAMGDGFKAIFAAGNRYLRLEEGVANITNDPLSATQFELISREIVPPEEQTERAARR